MQNIGRANQNDPHFRYKMPKLIAKQEGKGNGKKTIVVNIYDIGKALARPSEHPMKYMGYELGCIATYDSKKDSDRGGTLMGWHDQNDLAEKLDDYIDNFLLCPQCGNPETVMNIDKRDKITLMCKACTAKVSDLPQPSHKLAKYIVQHPEQIGIVKSGSDKMTKEEKRAKKIEAQKKAAEAGEGSAGGSSELDEKAAKKAAKAAKKAAKEAAKGGEAEAAKAKLHGYTANKTGFEVGADEAGGAAEEEDDDDWGDDADDADAQSKRREEFFADEGGKGSSSGLALVEDDDETRIEILRARLAASADKKAVVDHFKSERGGLKDVEVVCYLVEAAFTEDVVNEIKAYAKVLKPYCQGPKMDKCQAAVVLGLEELIGERFPEQLNTNRVVPKIFEALYDNDLVNEEVILIWFAKGIKGYRIDKGVRKTIRENCAAFANWLKEAEEDDSDEE